MHAWRSLNKQKGGSGPLPQNARRKQQNSAQSLSNYSAKSSPTVSACVCVGGAGIRGIKTHRTRIICNIVSRPEERFKCWTLRLQLHADFSSNIPLSSKVTRWLPHSGPPSQKNNNSVFTLGFFCWWWWSLLGASHVKARYRPDTERKLPETPQRPKKPLHSDGCSYQKMEAMLQCKHIPGWHIQAFSLESWS